MKHKSLICAFFAAIMLIAAALPAYCAGAAFSDVPADGEYENAVYFCSSRGYMTGTSNGSFSPDVPLTRAMAVTALASVCGVDKSEYAGETGFTDVPAGRWYSAPVKWAYENGITAGCGNGRFLPEFPVTREQFAVMLRAAKEYSGGDVSASADIDGRYSDSASVHGWAKRGLSWAEARGIVTDGGTGALDPRGGITRGEAAEMIYRFCGKLLCVYFDGLWDMGLNMSDEDIAAADIVYYLSIYVKSDASVELSNKLFKPEDIAYAKEVNPDLKVLVTLVGDNRGQGANGAREFSGAVTGAAKRAQLCENVAAVVREYGFDGADINWEYPQHAYDKSNEVLFAQELRLALKRDNPDAMLTAAVPATMYGFDTHDILSLLPELDYLNVMTYDFHINDTETLHHTAPRNDATGKYAERGYSCEKTVEQFVGQGVPADKIIMGCGLYTLEWCEVEPGDQNGFNSTGRRVSYRTYHYKDLPELTAHSGFTRYWDPTACAAWWYNPRTRTFLSSDDDESVREKAKLSYENYTAGLMIFSYHTMRGGTLLESTRQWLDGNAEYPPSIEW